MPRFSIEENSSSSDDDPANRVPKRRRVPFPSRVLYRHGTSSTTPSAAATVITAGGRQLPIHTTPAARAAGASTSQPDSDESVESSDYDEDDDDDEEEEAEIVAPKPAVISRAVAIGRNSTVGNLNKAGSNDVVRSGSTSDRVPAMISDTDVFDCAICFEPFTIPVYQCDNGHTACSSCCGKLRNKCPSCCSPIGYNRCRALEKVLEVAKITCSNNKYGCQEKVSYSMKREHERSCAYEPCYCPLPGCYFDGSYKDLYLHFARKHPASATRFTFDSSFSVHMGANMKYKFLQEHGQTLFILNYGVQSIGNVANIICIGPSSKQKEYSYELEASNVDSSVKLTSLTQSQPKWTVGLPQKSVLVVPKVFIDSSGEHNIQVCIRRKSEKRLESS